MINDDPNRVIAFNPNEVGFAERFYSLIQDFEQKHTEYLRRAKELDEDQSVDNLGLPLNTAARLVFMREVCEYLHAGIDRLFGAGTSQMVFEGALGLDMIGEFFEGIVPLVQQTRAQKVTPYMPVATNTTKRKSRSQVMR